MSKKLTKSLDKTVATADIILIDRQDKSALFSHTQFNTNKLSKTHFVYVYT